MQYFLEISYININNYSSKLSKSQSVQQNYKYFSNYIILYSMKYNCKFHTNKTIEWFCTHTNCLLPLCQLCLKIHHSKQCHKQTISKIERISHSISDVSSFYKILQREFKVANSKVLKKQYVKNKCLEELKKLLVSLRNENKTEISEEFNKLQNQFLFSIEVEEKKINTKLKSITEKLNEKFQDLQIFKKQIDNRNTSLSKLIRFYKNQERNIYQIFLQQLNGLISEINESNFAQQFIEKITSQYRQLNKKQNDHKKIKNKHIPFRINQQMSMEIQFQNKQNIPCTFN